MHFFPTSGPSFQFTGLAAGTAGAELRRGTARTCYGRSQVDPHTRLHLRARLASGTSLSSVHSWDHDEVQDWASAWTDVRHGFATQRPTTWHNTSSKPEAPAAAPPPKRAVLPPPRKRKQQKADPGPAAKAFQSASRNGTATVCKGPCEACEQA